MKISWGIKIIISFILFAAGIITMAAISISRSTDLVSENYYEQEIKYQDQIDILKDSFFLDEKISITTDIDFIILKIPDMKDLQNLKGEIHFYRTSDAKKDFKINFNPDSEGIQKVSAAELDKGLWKVKLSLTDGGKKYFVEKNIFIN
ncbi:MAG: FixH family protein [Ignavibacteria bacterium]|nr:FixH family protein [Ignavibacteria bacterium]